jgi:NTP pyrophosphatase (non-canonical NTP hydrolase)
MVSKRPKLTTNEVNIAIDALIASLFKRIEQYGTHSYSSKHEILGLLKEEFDEISSAVHNGTSEELKKELLDIAVAAVYGYACIDSKKVDW